MTDEETRALKRSDDPEDRYEAMRRRVRDGDWRSAFLWLRQWERPRNDAVEVVVDVVVDVEVFPGVERGPTPGWVVVVDEAHEVLRQMRSNALASALRDVWVVDVDRCARSKPDHMAFTLGIGGVRYTDVDVTSIRLAADEPFARCRTCFGTGRSGDDRPDPRARNACTACRGRGWLLDPLAATKPPRR